MAAVRRRCLRLIPGSHRSPLHDKLGEAWAETEEFRGPSALTGVARPTFGGKLFSAEEEAGLDWVAVESQPADV